jgi:hypothetical protein
MTSHKRPQATMNCLVCNKSFQADRSKVLRGTRKCCSISCRGRVAASKQINGGRKPKHGGCVNGRLSPLYKRWSSMKSRCHSEACAKFGRYGARNIRVCKKWRDSFKAFEEWSRANGFRPELQLDRKDNNKGYSPTNCRWVTCIENQANRHNSLIFPSGETTAQVADRLGMSPNSIRERLKRGMTPEQAMTLKPVPNGYERKTFNLNLWKP